MSEDTPTDVRTEGDKAFPTDKENENSSSSSEENNDSDQTDSSTDESTEDASKEGTGDSSTEDDKGKEGFQEHPRWKEREENWKTRFNDQETRHTDAIEKLREDFGKDRKDNATQTKVPSWFGGDEEQWAAFRADQDTKIKEAEERVVKRFEKQKETADKAVTDATEFMQSEISEIESDKELNPDGSKIDPNKLLKFVLDNDLVDSKGRWNYRAGFRLMKVGGKTTKDTKDRKKIASATTSESKSESKPTDYKTRDDFKAGNKPW